MDHRYYSMLCKCNISLKSAINCSISFKLMSSSTKTLFKDQSKLYSLYRPSYDKILYDNILNYNRNNSKLTRSIALDVATGNGQAAYDLCMYYDKVIGMDIQENQIKQAFNKAYDNIQFIEGSAENISLESNSIDLVCVAQALHWFDTTKFYKEAHRVMKETGTLAIWGYDLCYITANKSEDTNNAKRASNIILHLYKNSELAKYWDNRRFLIDNHYATISPNSRVEKIWKNVQLVNMNMSKQWKVSDLVKYISTWSAYNTYIKEKKVESGSNLDPCIVVEKQLIEIYGTNETEITITWPIFLYLATK